MHYPNSIHSCYNNYTEGKVLYSNTIYVTANQLNITDTYPYKSIYYNTKNLPRL